MFDENLGEEMPESPTGEGSVDSEVEKTPEKNPPKEVKTVPYERFKEINDKYVELKKQKEPVSVKEEFDTLSLVKDAKALSKYSDAEAELIVEEAKLRKLSIADAEKLDFIQDAIMSKREKVEREKTVPSPSANPNTGITNDKIGAMSRDDHRKLEEEFMRKQKSGGAGV